MYHEKNTLCLLAFFPYACVRACVAFSFLIRFFPTMGLLQLLLILPIPTSGTYSNRWQRLKCSARVTSRSLKQHYVLFSLTTMLRVCPMSLLLPLSFPLLCLTFIFCKLWLIYISLVVIDSIFVTSLTPLAGPQLQASSFYFGLWNASVFITQSCGTAPGVLMMDCPYL